MMLALVPYSYNLYMSQMVQAPSKKRNFLKNRVILVTMVTLATQKIQVIRESPRILVKVKK